MTHKQWLARQDDIFRDLRAARKAAWTVEQRLRKHVDTPCDEQETMWHALRDLLPLRKVHRGWWPLARCRGGAEFVHNQGFTRCVAGLDTVIAWNARAGYWEVWKGCAIDLDNLLGPGRGIVKIGSATTVKGVIQLIAPEKGGQG